MATGMSWFKVKRDKLRRQNRDPHFGVPAHGTPERFKPLLQRHETIAAANARRAEIGAMVQGFKGAVVHGERGKPVTPAGKGKRAFDSRTYGNGRRRTQGLLACPDMWATDTETRLIPAAR